MVADSCTKKQVLRVVQVESIAFSIEIVYYIVLVSGRKVRSHTSIEGRKDNRSGRKRQRYYHHHDRHLCRAGLWPRRDSATAECAGRSAFVRTAQGYWRGSASVRRILLPILPGEVSCVRTQ